MSRLPCKIDGLPLLHLSQAEERILRVLIDGRVHTTTELVHAVWMHWPPTNVEQCLKAVVRHSKANVMSHGYLLIFEPNAGYSLIKDTRKFD